MMFFRKSIALVLAILILAAFPAISAAKYTNPDIASAVSDPKAADLFSDYGLFTLYYIDDVSDWTVFGYFFANPETMIDSVLSSSTPQKIADRFMNDIDKVKPILRDVVDEMANNKNLDILTEDEETMIKIVKSVYKDYETNESKIINGVVEKFIDLVEFKDKVLANYTSNILMLESLKEILKPNSESWKLIESLENEYANQFKESLVDLVEEGAEKGISNVVDHFGIYSAIQEGINTVPSVEGLEFVMHSNTLRFEAIEAYQRYVAIIQSGKYTHEDVLNYVYSFQICQILTIKSYENMQKNYKKTDAEYKYIAEQLKSLKKMNSANPIKAVKFKDFHEHIYDDYGYCRVCTEEFPIQKVSMRNATYYAAKDDVPIRKRPYSPERTIDSIDKGEAVTVINSGKNAKGNLWYELKDKTWVYSENVSETKPKTTPAKTASKGKFTIKDLVGINDYSILYVRTAEEAEKLFVNAFGKPTSKESFDGPYNGCSVNYDFDFGWGFYASSDFDDPIGRRPHYNMSIDSPSFDGPRGLRVGDTAEKVTATFGKADDTTRDESGKIQRMDYNESFGDWTKGEDNWGATIYFFFDNGRISLIDMNVTGDLSN